MLEPILSIFQELRDNLNRLCLNQEAQERMHATISSLKKTNEALKSDNSVLEKEKLQTEMKFNEIAHKLKICEEDLKRKTADLDAEISLHDKNPSLISKITCLEKEKENMENILGGAEQKLSEVNDEWKDICSSKEQTILELQQTAKSLEARIQGFENEKIQVKIRMEDENKQICQELTKKAEVSKATMKLKLETEVKNLEQKLNDKNAELDNTRAQYEKARAESLEAIEENQKLRTASEAIQQTSLELQTELICFKEQFSRQAAQIQILEVNSLDPQTSDDLPTRLRSIFKDISEIRLMLQAVKKDNAQVIGSFSLDRKAIEDYLDNLLIKQYDEEARVVEDLSLQENLEILEASFVSPSTEGDILDSQTLENSTNKLHIIQRQSPTADIKLFEESHEKLIDGSNTKDVVSQEISICYNSTQPTFSIQPSLLVIADEEIDKIQSSQSKDNMAGPNSFVEDPNDKGIKECFPEESIRLSFDNPADSELSQTKTDSSSLTNIEPIVEILPSLNRQEELSKEYKKARKVKNDNRNCCKPASPLATNSQKVAQCGLKRCLQSADSAPNKGGKPLRSREVEDEPAIKRQKPRANDLRQKLENSRCKQSGVSRTARSSLSQIERKLNADFSSQNCKTCNFEGGSVEKSHGPCNQHAEPNGCNVKQRRQDLNTRNFMGDNRDFGVRLSTRSSTGHICDRQSASVLSVQDLGRSQCEKKGNKN